MHCIGGPETLLDVTHAELLGGTVHCLSCAMSCCVAHNGVHTMVPLVAQ